MNVLVHIVLAFLFLVSLGVGLLAIGAAVGSSRASRLEEGRHYVTPDEVVPLTDAQQRRLVERISDGLIDDFEVWTDDLGFEHIVPVSPRHAAEDRPPPAA